MKDGRAELPCDIQPPDSNDKVPSMAAILLVLKVKDYYEIYACMMMHNNLLLTSPTIQVHLVSLEKSVDDDDDFGDADDDV